MSNDLSQVSEGFRAASGGESLIFLVVLGVIAVTFVIWGIHYHYKRREHSFFDQV